MNWTVKNERTRLEARYACLCNKYMSLFAKLAVEEGVKFPICIFPYVPLAINGEWYVPSIRHGILVFGRKVRLLRLMLRCLLRAKSGDDDMQWFRNYVVGYK